MLFPEIQNVATEDQLALIEKIHNEDGFNDSFIIPCLANHPGSSITIFNRWGDEVYRSDNYQNDWEGTYNGELLPTGTYYYLLEVNDAAGTTLNGYLFLQR